MLINAYITRAFCRNSLGGNFAGVVVQKAPLSSLQMQKLASLLNFSETIFLLKKAGDCFQATYYTPTSAIDFCGHASISAFKVLTEIGELKSSSCTLETQAGICSMSSTHSLIFLKLPLPAFGQFINADEIADVLGIDHKEILPVLKPQIVSTGLKDIMVPTRSQKILLSLRPDLSKITHLCEKYDVIGMHVFALDTSYSLATAHCRNFAPRFGIPEESATGSSNGALSSYLFKHKMFEKQTMLFQQGDVLNFPSDIHVRLTTQSGEIDLVECGGEVIIDEIRSISL